MLGMRTFLLIFCNWSAQKNKQKKLINFVSKNAKTETVKKMCNEMQEIILQ